MILAARAAAVATLLAGSIAAAPGADAAPTGTPAVSRVHAATAGSTAVRLTWHDPAAAGRLGTLVRYAKAPDVPASPAAGSRAGRVGAGRDSLTVRGLRPSTRYAFALFAYYGAGRYAARRVVRITTAPDSVRLVQPFARGAQVSLAWQPPARRSYAGTVVRYARGGSAPSRPGAGIAVGLSGSHATSARLTGLAAGATYAVTVWTRDRAGHYSSPARTRFTMPRADVQPTGTVQGTVTDAAGNPLAGVAVSLWVDGSDETPQATTDAAGDYSFAAPAGPLTLLFDGADATGGSADATGYQGDRRQVTVPAGGTLTESIALDPGAAVAGQVTDLHGQPLAGVSVVPQPARPYVSPSGFDALSIDAGSAAGTTGGDGRYLIKGLPPVALQICYDTTSRPVTGGTGDAAGYLARCERGAVAVAPAATRTLTPTALLPAATGTVTGVVTDAAGHPAAGVIVGLSARDGDQGGFASATTDATGRYRAGGLAPGRYDVCADPTAAPSAAVSGALTCRFGAARVTRGATASVDVRLRAAGALAGRLRGPNGAPVTGADAVVQSAGGPVAGYAETDAHGQYLVPDLAPGEYRVCFDTTSATVSGVRTGVLPTCHAGGDLVQVRPGSVRLGVDASLAIGGAVAGTVTGAAGSDVAVEVTRPGDEESTAYAFADGAGRYTVPSVPAGRYLVCAVALDPATGATQACHRAAGSRSATAVRVRAGRVTGAVGIALPASGSLTATVTDGAGHPVTGVNVVVLTGCPDGECGRLPLFDASEQVAVAGSAMTDGSGRVTFGRLRPSNGGYAVCALTYYAAAPTGDPATGYLDACSAYGRFGVKVAAGHDTAIAFTLHPAGAVRGTVTDANGHPLAGVRVQVSASSSSDYYDPTEVEQLGDLSGSGPGGPAAEVTTDADGGYVVRGVTPGARTVCFDAGSALDVTGAAHPTGIVDQCAGGAPGSRTGGTPVTVPAGGTLSGVDQQLVDGAVVAGRVLDRRTGRPIRYASVLVFAGQHLLASGVTNGQGHYSVGDLAPGTVRVCFAAYPYDPQCYDGVPWPGRSVPAAATALTLTAGGTRTLKDARLRRG